VKCRDKMGERDWERRKHVEKMIGHGKEYSLIIIYYFFAKKSLE
jgi:hypothetical protein